MSGRLFALLLAFAMAPSAAIAEPAGKPVPRLAYQLTEGENLNAFYRQGPVAAHVLLRSGRDPRVLVAFPAGNSGIGLWFDRLDRPAQWRLDAAPHRVIRQDARGRALYGVTFDASIAAPVLTIKQTLASSVRVLRDYQGQGTSPANVQVSGVLGAQSLVWARDRLDGSAGYRLQIDVLDGGASAGRISAGADHRIGLRITALGGDTPLTPLDGALLLNDRAGHDPAARNALTFLSYREKFLAGSWRFNTYFGRDTLMSVRLMMPVLQAPAIEAGLGAVLSRLSADGKVAHEEDIGEFAIIDHQKAGDSQSDAPSYNYTMIDGNYLLAPVAGRWLLDDARGRRRAAAFLAQKVPAERRTYGDALAANLRLVLATTMPFGKEPVAGNLIALLPGAHAGQWRDSDDGLGQGRKPYDVNAVLAPAALDMAGRLYASGLLAPYLQAGDQARFAQARALARIWYTKAPPLFDISIPHAAAAAQITHYAALIGVGDGPALKALGENPVRFHALSLNADGTPVRILHSDDGFALLFSQPKPADVDHMTQVVMRPFPLGLLTDAGVLVANPAFAAPDLQARFGKSAYHGTVVWSWQQALLAAGLDRQLARRDLPAGVRGHLVAARAQLWAAIAAGRRYRNSELWSWAYQNGHFVPAAFGADAADADESNAAQLWSTVFLALKPPHRGH